MENTSTNPSPQEIRRIILTAREPLLFTNLNNWRMLQWDLNKWMDVLKCEELQFRKGSFKYTQCPQWESTCEKVEGTLKDFIEYEQSNPDFWLYFDYKYLKEWFCNIQEIRDDISWSSFGFDEINANDSTIWIGSTGAHTPCHIDTYGCNLITQIYGSKRWILFPPEVNLLPTRIPYEESSIYSKINFFSPNLNKCKAITSGRTVILKPGETLFVPPGWWHYVENLEIAISINAWIPMENDCEYRLEESIVQLMALQLTKELDVEEKNRILIKPDNKPIQESLNLLENCCEEYKQKRKSKKIKVDVYKNTNHEEVTNETKLNGVCAEIPILTDQELQHLLLNQLNRFSEIEDQEGQKISKSNSPNYYLHNVFDAFLHPEVIALVKSKIIKSVTEE